MIRLFYIICELAADSLKCEIMHFICRGDIGVNDGEFASWECF
jgi:hypothetical protein